MLDQSTGDRHMHVNTQKIRELSTWYRENFFEEAHIEKKKLHGNKKTRHFEPLLSHAYAMLDEIDKSLSGGNPEFALYYLGQIEIIMLSQNLIGYEQMYDHNLP